MTRQHLLIRLLSYCFFVASFDPYPDIISNYSSRHHCTFEHLLSTENDVLNIISNMISPLQVETFFGKHFEVQSTAVLSRPQDFYSRLINIGVVPDYLRSQGKLSRHTSEGSDPHIKDNSRTPSSSLEGTEIHHGGDWKLVKRVWKDGSWWSSTPNISMIPFEVVFASFQRHGYSIVIDKMQNFHAPLRIGEPFCRDCSRGQSMCNLFDG